MWKRRPIQSFLQTAAALGLFAASLAGVAPESARANTLKTADNFRLLDQTGHSHELHQLSESRAVVLVTAGNGCPIVRQSLDRLKELRAEFAERNVTFLLLNANSQDERAAIAEEAKEFGIDFPVLKDRTQMVAHSLGARRTAEVFAIDPRNWTIFYHGAIDDRLGYGTQKTAGVQHFLRNALNQFLEDEEVQPRSTPVKGCAITFEHRQRFGDREISYREIIAPVLQKHCVSCHSSGQIGPFAMSNYERVKGWASTIRETLLDGRMPPWHADPHHGVFSNDRSLSAADTQALIAWIDQGAPRGEGADPLVESAGREPDPWPMGKPDAIVRLPEPQNIPATGVFPYRYLMVPSPLEEDSWVRAAIIRPGNRKVLHHCLVFLRYPRAYRHLQPEYHGGAGGYFTGYVPGTEQSFVPEGTGKFLPKGSIIIFQMHYTATGKEETDETELGLYLAPAPPEAELKTQAAVQTHLRIPPGAPEHEVTAEFRFLKDSWLYSFSPHMHFRGSRFRYEAFYPDGSREMLLSVPRYDFNWQTLYELKEPKRMPAGTRIVCTGAFDNSARNHANPDPSREVRWGEQTWDEMFIGYLNFSEILDPDQTAFTHAPEQAAAPPERDSEKL